MAKYLGGAVLASLLLGSLASAWWVKGHGSIAEAGAAGLPDDVPQFFRAAGKSLNHMAGDPDRWKNRSCKFLRPAEAPDHYVDLENFGGKELPRDRYKAIELLQRLKQKPDRTGMLPYAIMENYERLCCAFLDYRGDKNNAVAQSKCVVYAGVLSHFTGDCTMPLHTTVDYDGKRDKDGGWLQKGIHARIDAFPERHGLTAEEIGRGLKAKKIDNVWEYVLGRVTDSHKLVGRCYELDKAGAFAKPTPVSRAFILERCRAGAQFTMDLWYTAWLRSAEMEKPF
jgi:hypothetical protein